MRSLMYVFICTRQDIEQTARVVSQFVEDPSKEHQNDVDRIMSRSSKLIIQGSYPDLQGSCLDAKVNGGT
ncbi:hypothetical protein MTR_1g078140 [Medicago truncatula]|uniref:Uncharacterized protein n=1 Tax=Medicago truncatula TaxID=3880 RepID=A0A072VXZ6_MEDTR|nr:hypothetical protein MTR_1g078140 [Medicago truncatula]